MLEGVFKAIDYFQKKSLFEQDVISKEQLNEKFRDEELSALFDIFHEISFAKNSYMYDLLFKHKMAEYYDEKGLGLEIAKEYHEGKLDPSTAVKLNLMRKRDKKDKSLEAYQGGTRLLKKHEIKQ